MGGWDIWKWGHDIVIFCSDNDKWVVWQFSQFLLILLPQAQQKITSSVCVSPPSYIIEW